MNNKGFTLIELVVVIVVLGILAVTAAPKFINLQADAHTATLKAVKASIESASALVYSKSLIKGNEDKLASATPTPTVVVDNLGTTVNLSMGYPISTSTSSVQKATDDWANLLNVNSSEFIILDDAIAGYIIVHLEGDLKPTDIPVSPNAPAAETAATKEDCFVYYKETKISGTKPEVNVAICL